MTAYMEELEQKNNYTRNTDLEQLFQPLLKNDVLDNSLNANIIINYGFGKSIVLPNYVSDILLEFIVSEINYRKKKELGKGLF